MECVCTPNCINPCGPGRNCLARITKFECNPETCPAKDLCQNQQFSKKDYCKLQVQKIANKGWGLFATNGIPSGSFIVEYIGEVINEAEMRNRKKQKQEKQEKNFYFLRVNADMLIDSEKKGNLARFINHSCDPNCETQIWTVMGESRVGIFAIKDIEPVS